ncbi:GPI mannosyltransferase 4-like protein, partial [Dinothrombium tinctorium]
MVCLSPEHGYIHPDEFFQFSEPIAANVLNSKAFIAWELTATQPIRSVFLPLLITGSCFKLIALCTNWPSPWLLLVVPRLVMTLLSFVADFCLYRICDLIDHKTNKASLYIFATSYLTLCYCTHTFTNAIELILLSILMLFVVKSSKRKQAVHASAIGLILCVGLFNRPTFGCFAIVPLMFWLFSEKSLSLTKVIANGTSILPSFAFMFIFSVLIDTLYYRNESTFDDLNTLISRMEYEQIFDKIVITPMNFINYNIRPTNLQKHGLHPRYQHSIINVPLAFTMLGMLAYSDLLKFFSGVFNRKLHVKFDKIKVLMILTFVIPLILLSLIPHQEPRFLLPCLIPLCVVYSKKLYESKTSLFLWIVLNSVLVIIYGYVHQAGVTKALFEMHQELKTVENSSQVDIIIARTYLPPQHLLNIRANDSKVQIHDLSTKEFPEALFRELKQLKKSNPHNVYLLIPSCLTKKLKTVFYNSKINSFHLQKRVFPHFTFEDL